MYVYIYIWKVPVHILVPGIYGQIITAIRIPAMIFFTSEGSLGNLYREIVGVTI